MSENCTIVSYLICVVCVVVCGSSRACLLRRSATFSIRFTRKARCENRFWHALKSEYLQDSACLTRHFVLVVILFRVYDSASFGEKVAAVRLDSGAELSSDIIIIECRFAQRGCKWSQIFVGWVVLATASSAGRVDVGAELCRFMSFHISKIQPPRPDPIFPTQRIARDLDLILSTQRIPRGRDPILSTQRVPRG